MARQESQSKLLYYPTPNDLLPLIASWITVPDTWVRFADPCVGEGVALRVLRDLLNPARGETWGVELSYSRAEKAAQKIDTVLPTSFYETYWAERSVSLMLDNPPYDWSQYRDEEGKSIRHETLFLQRATPKLVTGGVHVLIIPQWLLGNKDAARHWLGWYEQAQLFRFPDGLYEDFDQIILIGVRREGYQPPTARALEMFKAYSQAGADLSVIEEGDGRYVLPPAPLTAKFSYQPTDDGQAALVAAKLNLNGTGDWQRETYVRPVGAPIYPLVQLKTGHLSMLVSAGELGVVRMDDSLVKGTLKKVVSQEREALIDDEGKHKADKVTERESLESVITVLHATGQYETISGTKDVGDFITKNAQTLANAVLERNAPFYDWQTSATEWQLVSQCATGLPPLPGRRERGLFDVQKHFAIALSRFMLRGNAHLKGQGWHHVILNAEMGSSIRAP